MGKVLLIEDDRELRDFVSQIVGNLGHELVAPDSFFDGSLSLQTETFDVVIIETAPIVQPPFAPPWIKDEEGGMSGRSLLRIIVPILSKLDPIPEFLFITRGGFAAEAQYAVDHGALDYVQIPISVDDDGDFVTHPEKVKERLINAIRHGFEISDGSFFRGLDLEGIVGSSWQIKRSLLLLAQAAKNEVNVLIAGETGTGKKLFAQKIHDNSEQKGKPFHIVDCRSVHEIDEVFDFYRNGARKNESSSDEGTILMYEIDSLPISLQSKLLWKLRDYGFSDKNRLQNLDRKIRIISSTSRNLQDMVSQGSVLKDLYYELSTLKINLPPLRNRVRDIIPIAQYHWDLVRENVAKKLKVEWSSGLQKVFQQYIWPGNISEMINALKIAISNVGDGKTLDVCHLPYEIQSAGARTLFNDSFDINENAIKALFNIVNSPGTPITSTELTKLGISIENNRENAKVSKYEHIVDIPIEKQLSSSVDVNPVNENTYYYYEEADFWIIGKPRNERHLKKLAGYGYIHFLLHYPNESFRPHFVYHKGISMINNGDVPDVDQLKELNAFAFRKPDSKARKAYEAGIEILEEKRESESDPEKALEIMDQIKELKTILKNENHDPKSQSEKARINVTKRIKAALKAIHESLPELGKYLNTSTIRTGISITYTPIPEETPTWILHKTPPAKNQ